VKWIAWGQRSVKGGTKEAYRIGMIDGGSNAHTALAVARVVYGGLVVDYVQSEASYEVERQESKGKAPWKNRRGHFTRKRK
jgi:hypothetical protein